ncbi:hypothetical protein D8911_07775 [Levilactobacillus brevis]|nr:hypothetical protein D8911_07775 [Levilactobacillus brevis]
MEVAVTTVLAERFFSAYTVGRVWRLTGFVKLGGPFRRPLAFPIATGTSDSRRWWRELNSRLQSLSAEYYQFKRNQLPVGSGFSHISSKSPNKQGHFVPNAQKKTITISRNGQRVRLQHNWGIML